MTSVIITGKRYLTHPDQANRHGPFDRVYLADGDSWMDASAAAQGSLPEFLTQEFNRRGKSHLIINIATSGQTLQRISRTMSADYLWWLEQMTFTGILFSAGGNDFIDAARDVAPGQGLLRDMLGQPLPSNGYDCVRQDALKALINDYLNPNFEAMYRALRKSPKNRDTPMFLNCYDTPVARNAPAGAGVGPWLWKAYRKNHIDPSLWPSLTQGLFEDIARTIKDWPTHRVGLTPVPTSGHLKPAAPGSTGSSGDWKNEIHPNAKGWKKQAIVWANTL